MVALYVLRFGSGFEFCVTCKQVTINEIIQFGKEYLGVYYIFWCTEEPYYSEQLVPFLNRGK